MAAQNALLHAHQIMQEIEREVQVRVITISTGLTSHLVTTPGIIIPIPQTVTDLSALLHAHQIAQELEREVDMRVIDIRAGFTRHLMTHLEIGISMCQTVTDINALLHTQQPRVVQAVERVIDMKAIDISAGLTSRLHRGIEISTTGTRAKPVLGRAAEKGMNTERPRHAAKGPAHARRSVITTRTRRVHRETSKVLLQKVRCTAEQSACLSTRDQTDLRDCVTCAASRVLSMCNPTIG